MHVVSGNDPLNADRVDSVRALVDECLVSGQPRVVFDLKHVPLIDSAGLELLLDAQDECVRRGGRLQIAGANTLCREILQITDVARHFEMFDDAVAAAGSFAQ